MLVNFIELLCALYLAIGIELNCHVEHYMHLLCFIPVSNKDVCKYININYCDISVPVNCCGYAYFLM